MNDLIKKRTHKFTLDALMNVAAQLGYTVKLAEDKADFAFESTLSSRTFAPFLRALKEHGYSVAIYYFSLANTQLAIRRVKLRVAQGGLDLTTRVCP